MGTFYRLRVLLKRNNEKSGRFAPRFPNTVWISQASPAFPIKLSALSLNQALDKVSPSNLVNIDIRQDSDLILALGQNSIFSVLG